MSHSACSSAFPYSAPASTVSTLQTLPFSGIPATGSFAAARLRVRDVQPLSLGLRNSSAVLHQPLPGTLVFPQFANGTQSPPTAAKITELYHSTDPQHGATAPQLNTANGVHYYEERALTVSTSASTATATAATAAASVVLPTTNNAATSLTPSVSPLFSFATLPNSASGLQSATYKPISIPQLNASKKAWQRLTHSLNEIWMNHAGIHGIDWRFEPLFLDDTMTRLWIVYKQFLKHYNRALQRGVSSDFPSEHLFENAPQKLVDSVGQTKIWISGFWGKDGRLVFTNSKVPEWAKTGTPPAWAKSWSEEIALRNIGVFSNTGGVHLHECGSATAAHTATVPFVHQQHMMPKSLAAPLNMEGANATSISTHTLPPDSAQSDYKIQRRVWEKIDSEWERIIRPFNSIWLNFANKYKISPEAYSPVFVHERHQQLWSLHQQFENAHRGAKQYRIMLNPKTFELGVVCTLLKMQSPQDLLRIKDEARIFIARYEAKTSIAAQTVSQ